ncbi:MAG: Gfo/Idh/MocA family oxidoreductase [Aestuariivirga sp.]|uniref:Gfo/Idh/MocA family protein n=1 Tax=Aestuariivirga sp. TaxID=2650926 RepID=UPI003019659B
MTKELAAKELGIGIIGTGFMGKAHAFAYRVALAAFPDIPVPRLEMIADVNEASAAKAAHQYGFARASGDWRALVNDPRVDVVSITTPNTLHKEMALAAIAAGKHVHCEKPLSPSLADSLEMVEAAEKKGVSTQVGFNYIKNPLLKQARDMIAAGELGEITGFRGIHAEDYMHDPDSPYSWRIDPVGGPGVIADLGSHIIGMARFLLGPIADVSADMRTVVKSRPVSRGAKERKGVLVDDVARILVNFGRGCGGTIEANWVATGRKMQLGFEISGDKGSLVFTQERLNELLFYRAGGDAKTNGYVKIESGPQHPPYGEFCIAGGHQLGFNDLKTIEMGEFLRAIGQGKTSTPDFREAYEIQKVVDAAIASSKTRSWVVVG